MKKICLLVSSPFTKSGYKKYGISIDKNSVHGSDSVENAKIEIDFFFKD